MAHPVCVFAFAEKNGQNSLAFVDLVIDLLYSAQAARTKYHSLGGFKQQRLIFLMALEAGHPQSQGGSDEDRHLDMQVVSPCHGLMWWGG